MLIFTKTVYLRPKIAVKYQCGSKSTDFQRDERPALRLSGVHLPGVLHLHNFDSMSL